MYLFNDAVSSSDYIASNDRMINKWERTRKETVVAYYPGIFLEGLRNTTKNLSPGSRSPGRDLKPKLPEYEAGVLTTQPRR
jgi:hypothetical protein